MTDRRQELEQHYKQLYNLELLPEELVFALDKAQEYWPDAWFGTLEEARSAVAWEFACEWDASIEFWIGEGGGAER